MESKPSPSRPRPAGATSGGTTAPVRRSGIRKWLGRFAYLLFLLVVVEVALQVYYFASVGQPLWDRATRPIYARNEHTVYWNKPNLSLRHNTNEFRSMLYTNSQGLRSSSAHEEFAKGRDPSLYRIVLMGPSFAYGWGVNYEDTFGAYLEHMLNDARFAGERRVQVINAGVPSLGPASNLAWFQNYGKEFQADLVIQFIYGSMEVPRDVNWNDYDVDAKGYVVRRNQSFFMDAKDLAKNSAVVFYGWTAWARLTASLRSDPGGQVAGAGRPMQVHTSFDATKREVTDADAFYDQLRDAIKAANAGLLVVHFPLAYGIHPEDMTRWRHLGVQNVEEERRYNQQFCEHVAARGVECLNITQQLIDEAKKGGRLYFWLDIHWTPEGNRAAARAVADHLLAGKPTPGGS